VVYTSDQGFFLGDHGWFDKRMMYEESVAMPLLVRYPAMVEPGSVCDEITLNVDFAPTFLELAGVEVPTEMQGTSFAALLAGERPDGWQRSMYYRYWMHDDWVHRVPAHYGVRTRTHKLIGYYSDPLGQLGAREPAVAPEWELFDLMTDPHELHNVITDPAHRDVALELRAELARLQAEVGDEAHAEADAELDRLLGRSG
jgi:arylsulfatase A-like enzyme